MKENETILQKSSIKGLDKRLSAVMDYLLRKNPVLYKTKTNVAEAIGFPRTNFSAALKGEEKYLTDNIVNKFVSKFPELNKEWLLTGEGNMLAGIPLVHSFPNIPQGELKPKEYSTSIKVRLVSNKAKAGWSEGYYNEEYLEELPFVMIDADENYKGKYLAFEVEGDSMEPDYLEGDIVICREIQRHLWSSKLHFRDWDFVIAHSTNGIMLKEITAHNIETGDITCHSLNPKYEDFVLNLHQVAHLYNVVEVRQKGRNKRWNRAKDFM